MKKVPDFFSDRAVDAGNNNERFERGFANGGDTSEMTQECEATSFSNPRYFIKGGAEPHLSAPLSMKGDGESMRFVAKLLKKSKG